MGLTTALRNADVIIPPNYTASAPELAVYGRTPYVPYESAVCA